MTEFATLLQQGNAWLFIPSAILLGALHGLEPGHSKTMMAAFIVAVRGTPTQAALLGLSATISHTAVVWIIAMAGLYFGQHWNAETSEPYFQLVSAVIIIGVAIWMLWRTWYGQHIGCHHHDHAHEYHHPHEHGHTHRDEHTHQEHSHYEGQASAQKAEHDHAMEHHHTHDDLNLLTKGEYQDAHERAHAEDIQRHFAGREVTTGQIVMFGLTGGLIPCPASITILLLCLQLQKITLGATLVLCFSIGLAMTLVASGLVAAFGMKYAAKRWGGFGEFTRKAPYFSGLLILAIGLYVGYHSLIVIT